MKVHLDSNTDRDSVGEAIRRLASESNSVLVASPYISGTNLQSWSNELDSVKVICNARSSGTNPFVLESLLQDEKFEVRSLSDLHSKIYCFDNVALLTSANATPNGLGQGLIESGCEIHNTESLSEIRKWFNELWVYDNCEDVSEFSKETWEQLKAQWVLKNRSSKKRVNLSDLILSKSLPEDLVFSFYSEASDTPTKDKIAAAATLAEGEVLPDDISKWNYWVESEDYESDFTEIDKIFSKYFGYKFINLKLDNWPPKKAYKTGGFISIGLDRAMKYSFRKKQLCLTFYRTDIPKQNFKLDKIVIDILNESIRTNKAAWEKYLKTEEGKFGYCSVKQFYKLLKT